MQLQILTQKDNEAYARLTAPQHIEVTHFRKHLKIDGYFENRDVPDFLGSDRLLKIDTIYGTIQMGYNPGRGQSFLFANIKSSIYDTASSRYQKELKEYQMSRSVESGQLNLAYVAKRRGGSSVILYKEEHQAWQPDSIAPYLRRINLEALKKTMPFMDRSAELSQRAGARLEQRELQNKLSEKMSRREYAEMAVIRKRQTELSARQDELNALIYRGDTQHRLFFRRLNYALDNQKHEMFAYYQNRRLGGASAEKDAGPAEPNRNEDDDE